MTQRSDRLFAALTLTFLALLSCDAVARRVEIRVIHTTDLHGHILPTRDYDGNENVGGLLRCSTLIRQLRAERDNTLLVDSGDLFQGSPEGLLTGGEIMPRAMAWLKYDAWTLGNHEFDWGLHKLSPVVQGATFSVLAANVRATPGNKTPLPAVAPYVIKELDGVRVAIIGLITPGVPTWSLPDLLGPLEFRRSVESLKDIMPALREADPDVIILTTHQGYKDRGDDSANEINAIAKNFPEIDVILGGHTHKPMEHVMIGDTLYSQAGYHGIWLGCVDIAFDTVTREIIRKEARLLNVRTDVEQDPALAEFLKEDIDRARAYMAEEIGTASAKITAAVDMKGNSPVQVLLARAIKAASKADVVLHGVLSEDDLAAGAIRMEHLWNIVPYENRIGLLQLTASEITAILEESAARQGTIHLMGCYGMTFDVEKDTAGQVHVTNLRLPDGSLPHPRKRFKVAMNSYVLASGGERFPTVRRLVAIPECRLEVLNVDTRSAVIDYVKAHSPLDPATLQGDGGR